MLTSLKIVTCRPHAPGGLPQFAYLAASIRMGKKYLIDHMQIWATNRIKRSFLASLSEYDKASGFDSLCNDAYTDETCLLLLNLAHEAGQFSVMPVVFYLLEIVVEGLLARCRNGNDYTAVKLARELDTTPRRPGSTFENRVDGISSWTTNKVDGCNAPLKYEGAKQR